MRRNSGWVKATYDERISGLSYLLQGKPGVEVAKIMGRDNTTISYWKNNASADELVAARRQARSRNPDIPLIQLKGKSMAVKTKRSYSRRPRASLSQKIQAYAWHLHGFIYTEVGKLMGFSDWSVNRWCREVKENPEWLENAKALAEEMVEEGRVEWAREQLGGSSKPSPAQQSVNLRTSATRRRVVDKVDVDETNEFILSTREGREYKIAASLLRGDKLHDIASKMGSSVHFVEGIKRQLLEEGAVLPDSSVRVKRTLNLTPEQREQRRQNTLRNLPKMLARRAEAAAERKATQS